MHASASYILRRSIFWLLLQSFIRKKMTKITSDAAKTNYECRAFAIIIEDIEPAIQQDAF